MRWPWSHTRKKRSDRECRGSGKKGKWERKYPGSRRRFDTCPHCKQIVRVRQQKSRAHGWEKGTLVVHIKD